MEPLFRDVKELSFGKIAVYKLPADPSQWITEIIKHFHEEYPWAGKYLTSVELKEKKPEEGYGLGWVEIASSTGEDVTRVKIPVIIKDNELMPMDVIIDKKGNYTPMTPRRLDESLFRPDLFEKLVDQEELKDQSEDSPFSFQDRYPPQRYGYYGSGFFTPTSVSGYGTYKTSSLIDTIKDTLLDDDIERLAKRLADDSELKKYALSNAAFMKHLNTLHELEKKGQRKVASINYESEIDPTVMQVVRLPKARYLLKTANPYAYHQIRKELDRPTALARLGEDIVKVADSRGSLTVTTNSCIVKNAEAEEMQSTGETATYQVSTIAGSPVTGIVFSSMVNFAGEDVPVRLFCSEQGYAMQDEIVGKKVKGLSSKEIPAGPPKGFGVFFWDEDGKTKSTEPVFVASVGRDEGSVGIEVQTMMGDMQRIIPTPVKSAVPSGEGLMIPSHAKFYSIKSDTPLPLIGSNEEVEKISSLKGIDKKITIRSIGSGRYNFYGRCGIEKLSKKATLNLDYHDALFLATTIGMSPEFAETKLAQAVKHGNTTVTGLHPITPIEEFEKKAEQKIKIARTPVTAYIDSLRQDLVKEAVIFEDEDTVDKVLALNFISPENIKTFVEYLPALEETMQKLNKLLIASRLGLEDLEETALTSTIEGLEKTIDGLKTLLHTTPGDVATA
jgi:hypothetical protein